MKKSCLFRAIIICLFVLLICYIYEVNSTPESWSPENFVNTRISITSPIVDMDGENNWLYYVAENELIIFDIKDPLNPLEVGRYVSQSNNRLKHLALHNNFVLISRQDGIEVIEVTDPTNPIKVGLFYIPQTNFSEILINGNYAFVGGYDYSKQEPSITNKHIIILDINDPLEIKQVSQINLADTPFAVNGRYLYAIREDSDGTTTQWLDIIDISDIVNPHLVTTTLDYGSINRGVVKYDQLYLGGSRGLVILDISNPLKPIELGCIKEHIMGMTLDNQYIYYVNLTGAGVIDISDPRKPRNVGEYLEKGLRAVFAYQKTVYVDDHGTLLVFKAWQDD